METCAVYRYEQDRLPEGDAMIAPDMKLKANGGVFRIYVPAQAVIVLTQK